MPRPPHDRQDPTRDLGPDDEAGWPNSVTELQRQHARAARGDRPPDDEAISTARLRGRKGRQGPASREVTRRVEPAKLPPGYHEPLDVRAGEAIVGGVRRAGGRTLDWLRTLSGQRLWTMVILALAGGALVGGIAAFGMRRALTDKPAGAWAGAREPAAAETAAPRDLVGTEREPTREGAAVREPGPGAREPAAPREGAAPREPAAARDAPPRAPVDPVPANRTLAARGPATLVIVSEPFGAEIAINGQSTGLKTPDSVEGLVAGRTYKVTLTRKGYRPWEEDIEIVSGGPRHVSARLEKGRGGKRRR